MDAKTRLHLIDMREFARHAQEFLGDLDAQDLMTDVEKFYAVSRAVELIGEAANRVPPSDRDVLHEVPWAKAIGMRNRIIHGYHAIDPHILVVTIREHVPPLIQALDAALEGLNR